MDTWHSSAASLSSAVQRARDWEDTIGGWVVRDDTLEADVGLSKVPPGSALQGVPFGVKDIIDVASFPTRFGSAAFDDAMPAREDSPVVAALRDAGAIPFGKTRTTEFAFLDPTSSRNPYDPTRTPGGSSSGSGAVVGARVVPFALGTQTAGSLIRPACYCGAMAYKPGLAVLPTQGVSPLAKTFDQVGVIAVSAFWIEAVFDILNDKFTISDASAARPNTHKDATLQIAEIAVPEQAPDAAIRDAMRSTKQRLADGGHTVVERVSPVSFTELLSIHRTIMLYEAARDLLAFVGDRRHQLRPKLAAGLAEGEGIPASDYAAALELLKRRQAQFWNKLDQYDLLLTYPVSGAAPEGLTTTGDQSYLSPWTALGGPLLSLPATRDREGMPLGLMFASPPGKDAALVKRAGSLETLLGRIDPPGL